MARLKAAVQRGLLVPDLVGGVGGQIASPTLFVIIRFRHSIFSIGAWFQIDDPRLGPFEPVDLGQIRAQSRNHGRRNAARAVLRCIQFW
ncbi:MAG: hypothetical protein WA817_21960 [Candidatus Acidiferrum sp.]